MSTAASGAIGAVRFCLDQATVGSGALQRRGEAVMVQWPDLVGDA
jgi:hypothetical protein